MFTVFGRGATTNEAYQDAKAAAAFYTEGDKRAWITEGESYRLFVDDDREPAGAADGRQVQAQEIDVT